MRRLLIIIFVLVLTLLTAVVATVQIVLSTDFPRTLVLGILEEETGLRFHATSLETGWGGRTQLRDLSIALPLEPDPFVTIPSLRISHTDLIRIVLTRDLVIDVAEIQQPNVQLRQDDQGRWNLLQAAEIVEQRQAARNGDAGEVPPLPKLAISDARIEITDLTGRQVAYGPITLHGEPVDALAWTFALRFEDNEIASGRLAPRASWSHRVEFDFQDIENLIAPWLDEAPPTVQAAGAWRGQVDGATLNGTLRLNPLRAGTTTLHGETAVSVAGPIITVRPQGMVVGLDDPGMPEAHLAGGRAVADLAEQSVTVDRVIVTTMELAAQLSAGWKLDDDAAWAHVKWAGAINDLQAEHEGTLRARLEMPRVGWNVLSASVHSHGSTPDVQWDSQWELSGRGKSWQQVSGSLRSPRLMVYTDQDVIDLAGFAARFSTEWPLLKLTHLDLPGAVTRGRGEYDADSGQWTMQLHATDWLVPGMPQVPFDLALNAAGFGEQVRVEHLEVLTEGTEMIPPLRFLATGAYDWGDLQPLDLAGRLYTRIDHDDLRADFEADISVSGILQPLDLNIDGDLFAKACSWQGRRIEDLTIPLRGTVRTDRAVIQSDGFDLLGGTWALDGHYERASMMAAATLRGAGSSIERVLQLVDAPVELTGTFEADVRLELPQHNLDQLTLDGQWQLADLYGEGLYAAQGSGGISFADQLVQLKNIELRQNAGTMTGRAEMHLDRVRHVVADVNVNDWRASLDEYSLSALLNGRVTIDLDVVDLTAAPGSELALQLDVAFEDEPLAELSFEAALDGRTVHLDQLSLSGLAGLAEGSGVIYLTRQQWRASTLNVTWDEVDLTKVPLRFEDAQELTGISSGTLRIVQSDDPRAPEPLQLDLNMNFADASYGPISLRDGFVTGYLGPQRLMIQESQLAMIDGTISMWGRVTQHEGQPFVHGHLQLDAIDLQQIADFLELADGPMPGRVTGSGSVGGYLTSPHRLFGQAQLQLTDSDLASAPAIAQLYNIFNIDFTQSDPTGRGAMLVRLEGDALNLVRLTYFNRGMDLVARLRVENIWEGPQSPITGLAGGAIRPLRDTRLPFIGDNLDRLLTALQADAATVRINGTFADPTVTVVPLSEVTGALGRIIRGMPD